MKKILCVLLISLVSIAAHSEPLDFVVLLDISESMLPYFDDTLNYLIKDILGQHLEPDDGFHLLSFADTPDIEVAFDIQASNDIDNALQRIYLLQPLGRYTDLIRALKYLQLYTAGVRSVSSKRILILTDGIHDPPPESPFPPKADGYGDLISQIAREIQEAGWVVSLVRFPTPSAAADSSSSISTDSPGDTVSDALSSEGIKSNSDRTGGIDTESQVDSNIKVESDSDSTGSRAVGSEGDVTDIFSDLSENLGVDIINFKEPDDDLSHQVSGSPELIFPEDIGKVGYSFTLPLTVRNLREESISVQLASLRWTGLDLLDKPASVRVKSGKSRKLLARVSLPASIEPGVMILEIEAGFSDDFRIFPRTGMVSLELRGTPPGSNTRDLNLLPFLTYTGLILAGLILLLLIFLIIRKLIRHTFIAAGSSPAVRGNSQPGDRSVEMHVEGQNPNIGNRNISTVRDGGARSIGGGLSGFLIYLYKFPMKIAEISRYGDRYDFVPIKMKYNENQSAISDCIGKDIILISDNERRVKIRFTRYVSALEKINQIMRLTNERGLPKKDY
jgi:hypothetical protein